MASDDIRVNIDNVETESTQTIDSEKGMPQPSSAEGKRVPLILHRNDIETMSAPSILRWDDTKPTVPIKLPAPSIWHRDDTESDDIRVIIDNVQTESTPDSEKDCTNELELQVAHLVKENAELKMEIQEISTFFKHEVSKLKSLLAELKPNQGMTRTSSTAGKAAPPIFPQDHTKLTPAIPWSGPEIVGRFVEISPTTSELECCALMHKVPHRLREVNPTAYEPNVISIGPYHYGKQHLTAMDVIKQICFTKMFEEKKLELGEFVKAMRTLTKRVRECYELPIQPDLNSDQWFDEMMILDGCFIVQLIRDMYPKDYLVRLGRHVQNDMWYDLLLLENQIPFFVLLELDRLITQNRGGGPDGFAHSALSFFQIDTYGPHFWSAIEKYPTKDIKHLLDLVHQCCRPSDEGINQHQQFKEKMAPRSTRSWKFIRCATELEDAGIDFVGEKVKLEKEISNGEKVKSLFDVTLEKETSRGEKVKLEKETSSGEKVKSLLDVTLEKETSRGEKVKLEKEISSDEKVKSLLDVTLEKETSSGEKVELEKETSSGKKVKTSFDVTFEKETTTGGLNILSRALKIPTLRVDDNTERLLRNFMAYEQFTPSGKPTYVSDYTVLMDNLLNSDKDVQLLCNKGVIDNWLGDDEIVAKMFNKLRDSIYTSDDFYYAQIFDEVDKHYNRKWNKYKAILRKDYFSSPWSLCSFVAAIVLLVVTLLQTAYTLVPYYYPS